MPKTLFHPKTLIEKTQFTHTVSIEKIDEDRRLVFGWASVVEEKGQEVVDSQGDVISEIELEKAAYNFVRDCRVAGEMHQKKGIGQLVESTVFTKEKQATLGISLEKSGWWIGFFISDPDVWAAVKSGKYKAFSWAGSAIATEIDEN